MATASEPSKRVMGATIAQAYFQQQRIPQELYVAVYTYANSQADTQLQAVVNSGAAQVSRSDAALRQALQKAGSALPARIYFHIRQESDQAAAAQLEQALEGGSIASGGTNIVVPGIQLVEGNQTRSLLKCLRRQECDTLGPEQLRRFREQGVAIEHSDLSAPYEQSTAIRANHFEAWFAPGLPG
jgi:hypothetical protein